MGSGYFDYAVPCDDDSHIPFKVTARQDECRGEKTCVREAIVSVYDAALDTTTLISFESNSGTLCIYYFFYFLFYVCCLSIFCSVPGNISFGFTQNKQ